MSVTLKYNEYIYIYIYNCVCMLCVKFITSYGILYLSGKKINNLQGTKVWGQYCEVLEKSYISHKGVKLLEFF